MTDSTSTPLKRQTLADRMAGSLQEAILRGEWPAGAALPTEPELAARFGVSRAVVRDATRLLIARGLVDARHGRGVFVTASPAAAFGDALLLALRRAGASVWDVERFEQMTLPPVVAEAARQATADDLATLRRLAAESHALFAEVTRRHWSDGALPPDDLARTTVAFRAVLAALFDATHNAVWQLLAEPLLRLRSVRDWQPGALTADDFIAHEARFFARLVEAVAAGDPDRAQAVAAELVHLPSAAEAAMRATPVGEVAHIPIEFGGRG